MDKNYVLSDAFCVSCGCANSAVVIEEAEKYNLCKCRRCGCTFKDYFDEAEEHSHCIPWPSPELIRELKEMEETN